MKKQIKYIIETVTSERDGNGNCYHFAVVTRVSDGETFTTEVSGDSNAGYFANAAGIPFEERYEVNRLLPKKEWSWQRKNRKVTWRERELVDFFGGCKHNSGKYGNKCQVCGKELEHTRARGEIQSRSLYQKRSLIDYHSEKWETMLKLGWMTWEVEKGKATMIRCEHPEPCNCIYIG